MITYFLAMFLVQAGISFLALLINIIVIRDTYVSRTDRIVLKSMIVAFVTSPFAGIVMPLAGALGTLYGIFWVGKEAVKYGFMEKE